jgi:hypothetical protein
VPRLPGQAAQGLLGGGRRVQGLRLLPHRQPRLEHVLDAGDRVERRFLVVLGQLLVLGLVVLGLVVGFVVLGVLVRLVLVLVLVVVRLVRYDLDGGLTR